MDEDKLIDEIRSHVAGRIAEGFAADDEIVGSALEMFEYDTGRDDLEPIVEAIVAEESARHHAEQALWEPVTDCDRLDRAFADLENRGIVARQDFSCCQNCGHGEIVDEIHAARATRDVVGYTFYHMQDTESAAAGHGLCLAYGSVKAGREAMIGVGREIVAAVRQAGLDVEWDEDPGRRISINNLDWKRRRP